MERKIKLFALTTCGFCRRLEAYLKRIEVPYECVFVDRLDGDERKQALEELRSHNPRRSFPTVVIGDDVIVGFKRREIDKALGIG